MSPASMPIIDAHTHLYPPELNRDPAGWAAVHEEKHWAELCTRVRAGGQPVQIFPSVDEFLGEMDAAGVERAVLLAWYWERPETCAWQNRFFAKCVKKYPQRFSAFASFHVSAGTEAVREEIRRAHGEGLVGLGELSPHSQGFGLTDRTWIAAMELAAELKMPVNAHVTDPQKGNYPGRVETPLADFTQLARDFPGVNFILAHWGGLLPLNDAQAPALTNVFYDTAASALLYEESLWKKFLPAVPAGHVLFGSDYPLNLYPKIDGMPGMARLIAEAHRSGLDADQLRGLMRGNARQLLGLS